MSRNKTGFHQNDQPLEVLAEEILDINSYQAQGNSGASYLSTGGRAQRVKGGYSVLMELVIARAH